MQSRTEIKDAFILLILASVLTLVLWFVPFAGVVTHPVRLFVTYVHEIGHTLAALGTWAQVSRVTLDWSGSGLTEGWGNFGIIVLSAGYLSTTLFGAGLLLGLRRQSFARSAAVITGVLLLAVTLFFAGNALTWATGLVFGAGLLALGVKGRQRVVHFVMSFLAVQLLFNAAFDLMNLTYLSAFRPGAITDAQLMSKATGGFVPAIVWAVGWSILSTAVLAATLLLYYKSLRARAALKDADSPAMISDGSAKAATPRM